MNINAVIFDVGGVLKDETADAICHDIQETLGISPDAFQKPWRVFMDSLVRGMIDEDLFWKHLHRETKAQHILPTESLLMRKYVQEHYVRDDVMKIVYRLRKAGCKTAILSNTVACHAKFNKERGVYDGFDPVVLSCNVALRKPDIEIFQLTAQRLEVEASSAVFVDDIAKNVAGAQEAGMHGILFRDAARLEEALQNLGLSF